jgi:hypothetical protein
MDLEGIDIAVLFGTFIGLGAIAAIEIPVSQWRWRPLITIG